MGGTLTPGLAAFGLLHFVRDGSEEDIFMGQLGVGVTYYAVPLNVYASAMVGTNNGWYDDANEERVKTGNSVALSTMLGKEWMVSDAWGVGPALELWYSNLPEGSYIAAALLFSATFH